MFRLENGEIDSPKPWTIFSALKLRLDQIKSNQVITQWVSFFLSICFMSWNVCQVVKMLATVSQFSCAFYAFKSIALCISLSNSCKFYWIFMEVCVQWLTAVNVESSLCFEGTFIVKLNWINCGLPIKQLAQSRIVLFTHRFVPAWKCAIKLFRIVFKMGGNQMDKRTHTPKRCEKITRKIHFGLNFWVNANLISV